MIGEWMLYAVAVGAGVSLIGIVLDRISRALGRPGRWGWALAMLATLLLPLLLPALRWVVEVSSSAAPTGGPAGMVTATASRGGAPGWAEVLDAALVWGWMVASAVVLLVIAHSTLALRRSREGWRRASVGDASVLVSSSTGPAVLGCVRSTIVVPAWVLERDAAEQRLIVLHEQEHARARDPLLLVAGWLALAAAPWNPALYWQLRRLRLAVEIDCDARVLRVERDVYRYGVLLVEVARRCSPAWLPAAAFAERSSFLERRIRVMTGANRRAGRTETVLLVLLAITIPLALFGGPIVRPPDIPVLARETGSFVERTILGVGRILYGVEEERVVSRPAPAMAARPEVAYEVAVLERQPRLSNQGTIASVMERLYPRILQDAGIGGTVVMQFVIEPDGTVDESSVKVIDSPHAQLTAATIKAVERFRFRPGRFNGENVRVLIQMPVTWQPAG
jgi:TonB family protein